MIPQGPFRARPTRAAAALRFVVGIGALLLASYPAMALGADVTAIRFGRLIDGRGGIIPDAVVIVEGDRIRARGPASHTPIPAGAAVIDLSRFTAIPGLIDVPTHMT